MPTVAVGGGNNTGFGTFIEGAAVDPSGHLYAVNYGSNDIKNTIGRVRNGTCKTVGVAVAVLHPCHCQLQVNATTGQSALFFTGDSTTWFNGNQFDKNGSLYSADL